MSASCTRCQDTGEATSAGMLDCTACDAADERVALNEFARRRGVMVPMVDVLWQVHQRAVEQERAKARAALGEIIDKIAYGHSGGHDLLAAEYRRIAP